MMAKLFEMSQPEISDTSARLQALDIERSWIVEAPAGSGKTGLLIQRYLRLLTDPNVREPEQVLAITFTKAATREIAERVLRELQQAQENDDTSTEYGRATRVMANAVLSRDHELGWRILDEPRRLQVRTIDSVCAEIARSLPILSGGNGSFAPIEDASSLYREAARRTWLHLGGDDLMLSEALRHLLLHRDGELGSCVSLISEMLAKREQWGPLIPLREEDLTDERLDSRIREELNVSLEQVVCDGLSRLTKAFPEQLLQRLATLATSLSDRPGYCGQPSPIAICRELRGSPTAAAVHLKYWRALTHLLITPSTRVWRESLNKNHLRLELSRKDKSALAEIVLDLQGQPELLDLLREISSLPPATFPEEQWPVTKALFRVLKQALAELQHLFTETAQCDFSEPAILARSALSQSGSTINLESILGTDIRHLLVDEMQDTSVRQYELLERLTEGWLNQSKTVFLVGDPKQSIYLFREARVERFIETMRTGMLGKLPVGLLQLTSNFRSQAGLLSGFNKTFSHIFPRTISRPEDVNYVLGTAARTITPDLAGDHGFSWNLSLLPGDSIETRTETRRQRRRDARRIRCMVEHWRSHPLPAGRTKPWKIAVLVQSRASLVDVLPELKRKPLVPFRALKIDALDERPEVLDLLALTRALLHLADRTAWLAVLRAPWCGLGLADLHILTGRDDDRFLGFSVMDLIAAHGSEVGPDAMMRLERVWPVLEAASRSSERLRLPERVERTWRSLGGGTFLDDAARKNAEAFFDLLRTIDREEGRVEYSSVAQRLKRLYASPEEGDVELVTIHGSKGLEWDVVLVPELERRPPPTKHRLFEIEELLNGRVILAPIAAKGADAAALNRWLREVRSRREVAERKRLFYVACTRAKEELHLFGAALTRPDSTATAAPGSLLEAAWPAAKAHMHKAMKESASLHADEVLSTVAANSEEQTPVNESYAPKLERLPLSAVPIILATACELEDDASQRNVRQTTFFSSQSPGPLSARCVGITVHMFLEQAALRLSGGASPEGLVAELPLWESRVGAILRAGGLPPRSLDQHVHTVIKAMSNTLKDPIGRWLLSAEIGAKNEFALVANEETFKQHRIDRIFRGGASPRESGNAHIWIIDYKTTAYAGAVQDGVTLEEFLSRERIRHAPQLERYSSLVDADHLRLGLWFPLLGRLVWWRGIDSR